MAQILIVKQVISCLCELGNEDVRQFFFISSNLCRPTNFGGKAILLDKLQKNPLYNPGQYMFQ